MKSTGEKMSDDNNIEADGSNVWRNKVPEFDMAGRMLGMLQ